MDIGKIDSNVTPGSGTQKSKDIWSVNNKGMFAGGEQKITFEKILQDSQASMEASAPQAAQETTEAAPLNATKQTQAPANDAPSIVNKRETSSQADSVASARDIWSVNNRGVFVGGEQKLTFEQLSGQSTAQIDPQAPAAQASASTSEPVAMGNPLIESAQAQEVPAASADQPGQSSSGIWSVNNKGVFVGGEQKITYQQLSGEPTTQAERIESQAAIPQTPESPARNAQAMPSAQVAEPAQVNPKNDIWSVNNRGVLIGGEQKITQQQLSGEPAPVQEIPSATSAQVAAPAIEEPAVSRASTTTAQPTAPAAQQGAQTDIWSVNNNGLFVNGEQKLTYQQLQALKTADSLSTQAATKETEAQSSDLVFSQTYEQRVEKEEKNLFQQILGFFNIK